MTEETAGTTTSAGRTVWRDRTGAPLTCHEKIKVLEDNLEEIRQLAQDAFEDGLLMECDEQQLRQVLHDMVAGLANPWPVR
ncbi:MAG: hypothetical protein RIE31_12155 [Alphaproteobacteria bacterium]